MRLRLLLVLAVFAVLDAFGIGLLLAKQGPQTADEAFKRCQLQVHSTVPAELGPCLRQTVSQRDVGHSRLVVGVPLILGASALIGVAFVLRGRPPADACPVCRAELHPSDVECAQCRYPLVPTA